MKAPPLLFFSLAMLLNTDAIVDLQPYDFLNVHKAVYKRIRIHAFICLCIYAYYVYGFIYQLSIRDLQAGMQDFQGEGGGVLKRLAIASGRDLKYFVQNPAI